MAFLCLASLTPRAHAQCERVLIGRDQAFPGPGGDVSDLTRWDPDGDGPEPALLLAVGWFREAGLVPASGVAAWDGESWREFGPPIDGSVNAITMYNGELVIGCGQYDTVVPGNVARWDGAQWQPLGAGVDGSVWALTVHAGELIAVGWFTRAGQSATSGAAAWNGTEWRPLGQPGRLLYDVEDYGGVLFAASECIYRFDGENWLHDAAWPCTGWGIMALTALDDGLYVGGDAMAGRLDRDHQWTDMSAGLDVMGGDNAATPYEFIRYQGSLVCAGDVISWDSGAEGVARWAADSWQPMPAGAPVWGTRALCEHNGVLFLGGRYDLSNVLMSEGIIAWDGARWSTVGSGTTGESSSVTPYADMLLLYGDFTWDPLAPRHNRYQIRTWDGDGWGWFPPPPSASSGQRFFVWRDRLYSHADRSVVQWSGSVWASGPALPASLVVGVTLTPVGNTLVAVGSATAGGPSLIYSYNGNLWTSLGYANGTVHAVAGFGDRIVVAGNLVGMNGSAISGIAQWDGAHWQPLGAGISNAPGSISVAGLLEVAGELVVVGTFNSAGGDPASGAAAWDGSVWRRLGTLPANALRAPVNFEGRPCVGATCWDGHEWTPLLAPWPDTSNIRAAAVWNGELIGVGRMRRVNGEPSSMLARYTRSNTPWFASQPAPEFQEGTLTLSAVVATGYDNLNCRWLRDGVPVVDGPGGASPGGGVVTGAASAADGGQHIQLRIVSAQPSDQGRYALQVTNACSLVVSSPSDVSIPCQPDLNHDGTVDLDDVEYLVDVIAGSDNPAGADPDFNRDGNVDQDDVATLINVVAGGDCPF